MQKNTINTRKSRKKLLKLQKTTNFDIDYMYSFISKQKE